jgi:2-polyprenyl-3-methyl-5-hydroxy-6-metoxy-1,4-benzoquinol methylase
VTQEDGKRWDEKWSANSTFDREPSPLLVRYEEHLSGGDALDLACGLGQNALWLAEQGYRVTAVDVSRVALERAQAEAQARGLALNFVEADLDTYRLPEKAFDVVTIFRFLDRMLFPAIAAALRPDGWLFYQTYNVRRLKTRPDTAREYLLELGELERPFVGLALVESTDAGSLSHVVCRQR